MRNKILLLIASAALAFSYSTAKAQSATFKDSVITYNKSTYKKGDTVQLFYGSKPDKSFAFVETVNYPQMRKDPTVMPHSTNVKSDDSKSKFIITKVYLTNSGKPFIQGRADWANDYVKLDGTIQKIDLTIMVDLEGAVDNKELVEPNNIVAPVVAKTPVKKKHS